MPGIASNTAIRTLIVDDEPLGRRKLRALLARETGFDLIGECSAGREAASMISELNPDLVFLDIQMPGMDAFQMIEKLKPDKIPLIIFVTAYDQYALRAFDCSALDYLLKPVDRKRFAAALEKARSKLRNDQPEYRGREARDLAERLRSTPKYLDRLAIKSEARVVFLKTDEIDWIEAQGKYVQVHAGKEIHLLREAISALESRLDPNRFFRVHRSAIVNLDSIRELQPWFNSDYRVVLRDGTCLTLSRGSRKKLSELVGNRL